MTPHSRPDSGLALVMQQWRSSLMDVSGNNRLLHFKSSGSSIDLNGARPEALDRIHRGQWVRVSQLFEDPELVSSTSRACTSLDKKQREALEEYGISVVFSATSFVTWDAAANQRASSAEYAEFGAQAASVGRKVPLPNAPLLLRPVSLRRRSGAGSEWEITLLDEYQHNSVLVHVLSNQAPALLESRVAELVDLLNASDSAEDFQMVMSELIDYFRSSCSEVKGLEISSDRCLGIFSYQKQPMVQDLSNMEAVGDSALLMALAGDSEAQKSIRSAASEHPVALTDADYKPVDSEYLVLDADASQSYVINAVVAGRNLVVQGPPGTGKSQTIANALAALAAQGKTVLFVAQKRAAIEAVLDRVEGVGLDHLVLDLFNARSSRGYVAGQLRDVLERHGKVVPPPQSSYSNAHQLEQSRRALVAHKDALAAPVGNLGTNVHSLRTDSIAIPTNAQVSLRVPPQTFSEWTPHTLADLESKLHELLRLGALDPGWNGMSDWDLSTIHTSADARSAMEIARELRWEFIPALEDCLKEAAALVGQDPPRTVEAGLELLNIHADAQDVLSAAPTLLHSETDIEGMLAAFSRAHRRELPTVGWGRRRAAKKQARLELADLQRQQRVSILLQAQSSRSAWSGSEAVQPVANPSQAVQTLQAFGERMGDLQVYVQASDLKDEPFTTIVKCLERLLQDERRVHDAARSNQLESELEAAGFARVLRHLRDEHARGTPAADPLLVFRWVVLKSLLDDVNTRHPELKIHGADLNESARRFQKEDKDKFEHNAARVRWAAANRLKEAFDAFPDQYSDVKTETTRKRKFRSVRRLLGEAPDVLLAAKPVWAMSPLQVSQYLPARECFDVVIFDEASQVRPADALPALMRAGQALVAGDSRQLPPTEFFTKVLEDETDDDDVVALDDVSSRDDEDRRRTAKPNKSLTRDAESILFAMERLLAGQTRSLQWHYRSHDERLIAVSNEHVYSGSLTTFPAPASSGTLRHEIVEYSPGIQNTANSPESEVKRVVDLIEEHIRNHPDESLGVIAFGDKHAHRIEDAIAARTRDNPEIESALASPHHEPFFVKAIERVQGDERDAIILSVGYGKGADGRLRLHWGPLLRDGGERRLNVAISRAKRRLALVTSFSLGDLSEDGHSSAGYKLLYHFIRYMESGGTQLTAGQHGEHGLNALEMDIRDRLQAEGLVLDTQLGVGGYRLDFAVKHPQRTTEYVLAIEADGASYHSGHTARERDRLRQTLLEQRGWTFHRIWSIDWFNDPDTQVKKATSAYQEAVRKADAAKAARKSSTYSPTPTADETKPQRRWHEAPTPDRGPRPVFATQPTIDRYPERTIIEVINWVRTDQVLRSEDEELRLVMTELGFKKSGSRIVAAITQAQRKIRAR